MLIGALITVAFYLALLFAVAWFTDRNNQNLKYIQSQGVIYGLSLGIYFTSWTFFGAVGTATRSGWEYIAIYLGPLLLMTIGFPIVKRMIDVGRSIHTTSIADFLSARYGKSGGLAAMVTLIAIIGTIPYIALQLRSVSMSLSAISRETAFEGYDLVPLIAITLAFFSSLFGTRHVDTRTHKRGLMTAISLETAVKLFALLMIGGFAIFLYSPADMLDQIANGHTSFSTVLTDRFITLTFISTAAILCLPRQFHVMVVECQQHSNIKTGRNIFIASLIITILVVIPITLAGSASDLPGSPDLYVISLPLAHGEKWLAVLAFLGGFSAATGMVIVSTVALSTMVTNDLLFGAFLRQPKSTLADEVVGGRAHIYVRRAAVFGLLMLATFYHVGVKESDALANLGILSFAAATQFLPALIGGLYWKQGHKKGVIAGLFAGFASWFFLLMMPAYLGPNYYIPLSIDGLDPLSSGVIISLASNTLLYILVSLSSTPAVVDRVQAAIFVGDSMGLSGKMEYSGGTITMADLQALMERCLGKDQAQEALHAFELVEETTLPRNGPATAKIIFFAERKIAGVLGNASARILMRSVMTGDDVGLEDIATVLGETQKKLKFSHELLQSTLDNMSQSVSVVDKDLRLIAWNERYMDMFDFPKDFLHVGQSISEVIAYNAQRGMYGVHDVDSFVERRMEQLRAAKPHVYEGTYAGGKTLQIIGNPMPGQNYVTTFTDITKTKHIEQELKLINETLEERVAERTLALNEANEALKVATQSKTRFLAAASHDLMQPLNAARLFASALKEELQTTTEESTHKLLDKLDRSIQSAEKLIRALLDISKLDSGVLRPTLRPFALNDVLQDITDEQAVAATQKGLEITYIPTKIHVTSDRGLIISVLQNLISNAVRYTKKGRILVGARRRGDYVIVQVWDTGPGMSKEEQKMIFKEFIQLNKNSQSAKEKGLGLGLAITERIAKLLNLDLQVRSTPGGGSVFEIRLARAQETAVIERRKRSLVRSKISDLKVLCIDNDEQVLDGLVSLLSRWNCDVETASNLIEAQRLYAKSQTVPDVVLLDYQLDDGITGPEVYAIMTGIWRAKPPVVMVTADQQLPHDEMPHPNSPVLQKPVEPAILRAALEQMVKKKKPAA